MPSLAYTVWPTIHLLPPPPRRTDLFLTFNIERQLLVQFRVTAVEVGEGLGVYVVGNTKQLG